LVLIFIPFTKLFLFLFYFHCENNFRSYSFSRFQKNIIEGDFPAPGVKCIRTDNVSALELLSTWLVLLSPQERDGIMSEVLLTKKVSLGHTHLLYPKISILILAYVQKYTL